MGGGTGRRCPSCDAPAPRGGRRSPARWCGACGTALGVDDRGSHGAADPADRSRVARIVAVTVLALALLVPLGVQTTRLQVFGGDGDDLDVGFGRDEGRAAVDAPVGDDGPVCLRDPACVVWVAPASVAGRSPTAAVAEDLTLVRVRDGLEARGTEDGRLRWRTALPHAADRSVHLPVIAAGGLALLTTDGPIDAPRADAPSSDAATGQAADEDRALLAVDLATGDPVWQLPGIVDLLEVDRHGDVLLAHVTRGLGDASPAAGGEGLRRQAVAIDAASGEVVWAEEGQLLELIETGVVVVSDGSVAVFAPSGEAVWERELEGGNPSWLDVVGQFLRLFDGQGRGGDALSLTDGELLDEDGELVPVADVDASPRDPFRSGIAALLTRRADGATDLALIDGDEVTWRVTFDQLGCCSPIQLDEGRIVVPAADGGRWLLDRDDGEVVDRTAPPSDRSTTSALLPSYGGISVEELEGPAVSNAELALVEDGQRTARLPAGTWPVGTNDEVVILRSHTWVAAIRRDRTDLEE